MARDGRGGGKGKARRHRNQDANCQRPFAAKPRSGDHATVAAACLGDDPRALGQPQTALRVP